MQLHDLLGRLELVDAADRVGIVLNSLPAQAPEDWRQLAAALAVRHQDRSLAGGTVLGVSGGQGAGKTTLSVLLERALASVGFRAVSLSLDDFYLTRAERQHLGRQVHPLLATRGVPGTHDVALAAGVLAELQAGRGCRCPRFDKAADDRLPASGDRVIEAGVDVVIFEGWCVGAPPQPAADLTTPCNTLEAREDPAGDWRRFVNQRLAGDYAPLWGRLDELLYLKVPDIAAVVRWRTEQEQQLAADQRMQPAALERFVAHYERLTLWMAQVLPERAQLVGFLDENHRLADLLANQDPG